MDKTANVALLKDFSIITDSGLEEHRDDYINVLIPQKAVRSSPFFFRWVPHFSSISHLSLWRLGRQLPEASIQVPPPEIPVLSGETIDAGSPVTFTDVPAEHWAKPALDELSARGLVRGFPDGSFQPDRSVTRAEFAAQVAKVFDVSGQMSEAFQDVTPDYWGHGPIQEAVDMGFLQGYPEQRFEPAKSISRAEVLVAIANGLNLAADSTDSHRLHQFQDHDTVPDWAQSKVTAAIKAGLLSSSVHDNLIRPNQPATRAEVVVIMHRTLLYLGELSQHS